MHVQLCPTLCNLIDCSPPSSFVHGIFQARILEWVAISSTRGIFPTQGSSPHLPCLLHWQVDFLPLHHLGSPRAYCLMRPPETSLRMRLRELQGWWTSDRKVGCLGIRRGGTPVGRGPLTRGVRGYVWKSVSELNCVCNS